jgi:hypothetical protein
MPIVVDCIWKKLPSEPRIAVLVTLLVGCGGPTLEPTEKARTKETRS